MDFGHGQRAVHPVSIEYHSISDIQVIACPRILYAEHLARSFVSGVLIGHLWPTFHHLLMLHHLLHHHLHHTHPLLHHSHAFTHRPGPWR